GAPLGVADSREALAAVTCTAAEEPGSREAGGGASESTAARRAARLFGAAAVLREVIGAPLPPSERAKHAGLVGRARAMLEDEEFAAAWAEGQAMDADQAVAYALGEPEPDEAGRGLPGGATAGRRSVSCTRALYA